MGHPVVGVEVVEDRAGGKRAEDQLEPELLRERDHPDQQDEGAADADLGARVLKPTSAAEIRRERSAAATPNATAAITSDEEPIRISFEPMPDSTPRRTAG